MVFASHSSGFSVAIAKGRHRRNDMVIQMDIIPEHGCPLPQAIEDLDWNLQNSEPTQNLLRRILVCLSSHPFRSRCERSDKYIVLANRRITNLSYFSPQCLEEYPMRNEMTLE